MARVLAVDWGERRVGLAVSDPDGIIATGLETLEVRGTDDATRRVAEVAAEREVGRIVVGLPLLMSGDRGQAAEAALRFARALARRVEVPVETYDERLTTAMSERRLREAGVKTGHERARVDRGAAVALLESYLQRLAARARTAADPGEPGAYALPGARRQASARRRPFGPRRAALLLLLTAAIAVAWRLFLPAGPFPPDDRRVLLIQRGQSVHEIAAELERVGLIEGTLGFEVLARLMRLDRGIKAGQYAFRVGTTVPALLRALARGMSGLDLVTIPEGLMTSEVSGLLSNHLGVPRAEFDSLAHDRAFLDSLGITAPSLEGYLAPDSYEFLPGTSPEVAFRTMARRTQTILLDASAGRDSLPLGLSLHQILALASIVESEAQRPDERARIARVYLNRLQRGMRLQADPTVAYGQGRPPRSRLFLRDLQWGSPYNTYLHEGLPPGPICNPGRSSIEATLNPTEGLEDLYFVSRGDGRHMFAKTYAEHLRNITLTRAMIAARAEAAAPDTAASVATDTTATAVPRASAGKQ